jgi:crossover junction endodeoxyribonuclease RusA
MTGIALTLPWPPTVNHQYRRNRNGGVRLSAEVRDFRAVVAARAMIVCVGKRRPVFGDRPVCVDVVLSPPDRRRRDIDGPIKALLDALTHAGIWEDDAQVCELHVLRIAALEGGECMVEVTGR